MLLLGSPWSDPARNLALEEYLLENPPFGDSGLRIVLFYENRESLIIGKNQNPWKEIPLSVVAAGSPRIYRRVTGGGAVYHGPGNLNFSFIFPQTEFSKEENLDLVRRAVARLGVRVERTERGDLVVGNRKISGNALCYRRGRVLHHGTLLLDADLDALRGSLSADAAGPEEGSFRLSVDTRAVESVPMSVANLSDFLPGLTAAAVWEALARELRVSWTGVLPAGDISSLVPRETFESLAKRYESWDWTFGTSPAFSCVFGSASPFSGASLSLYVERGFVSRAEGPDETSSAFAGKPFDLDLIDSIRRYVLYGCGLAARRIEHGHPGDVPTARQNSREFPGGDSHHRGRERVSP